MTRLSNTIHVALLCTLMVAGAGVASATYLNPVPEVSMKFCTGEGTPNTNHIPQMTDGCRNGAIDSNLWTSTLNPRPGSLIQVDLFLKIRREFLGAYALSVRFDVEGNDVLDYVAMSYYNLKEFYPERPLMCAPMGDPNETDGGCEEMTGSGLSPGLYYPEGTDDQGNPTRDIVTTDPKVSPAPVFDSQGNQPGWIYSIFAIDLGDGIRGTTAGQNGPVEVRIGSLWFVVNDAGEVPTTIRAGLLRPGVDVLMDKNGEYIGIPVGKPPPGWTNPETALTWTPATATIPEPGLATAQFAILAAVGWMTLRRRRR